MRLAARRDANEGDIVKALIASGCLVDKVSTKYLLDLVVWSPFDWKIHLLEVKRPGKKLRPEQEERVAKWQKAGAPVRRVESVDDALRAVGARPPIPGHHECRNCDGNGWVTSKREGATFKSLCPGFAKLGADLPLSKSRR